MLKKSISYLQENVTILTVSKGMAMLIMLIAVSNVLVAQAAGDFSLANVGSSVGQLILGLLASAATMIAGYTSTVCKTAVDYAYDWLRAHIANTVLKELMEDMHTFTDNEIDRLTPLFEAALKNDGKLDKAELNEMVDLVYKDAVAMWGQTKIEYIAKFRPQATDWVKAKLESYIRQLFDSFRGTKLITATAVSVSAPAVK